MALSTSRLNQAITAGDLSMGRIWIHICATRVGPVLLYSLDISQCTPAQSPGPTIRLPVSLPCSSR